MIVLSPYVDEYVSKCSIWSLCGLVYLSLYSKSNRMKYNGNYDENMEAIIYRNALQLQCDEIHTVYIYIYITIVYWESDHCKIDVNMANEVVFCIGDIYDICIKWLVTCSYYICLCQLHYVCISIAESQCYVMWRYIRYIITNKA